MRKKPTPPPVAEAHCHVVRIYERDTGQWFSTVAKDAIQVFVSDDVDTKKDALELAARALTMIQA